MKRSWAFDVAGNLQGWSFLQLVVRGYSEVNPCQAVKRPRADKEPPAIFTPCEAKKLLEEAYRSDNGLVPFLAIGLFAGVRPMEIMRLKWKNISGQYIEVSAAKSKTRQRRLVEVLPSLSSWLELGGELPARNKRKRLTAWLRNVAMATGHHEALLCEHHLAMFRSAEKTAPELGHRTQLCFQDYRELVQIADAEEYWSIKPPT